MKKRLMRYLLGALLFGASVPLSAQKATEMYIPIGKSPGLSGKYTVVGTITSFDADRNRLVVTDTSDVKHTFELLPASKIWIDRSPQKTPNRYGTRSDLRPGYLVEVMYVRRGTQVQKDKIEWVKVRPAGR